MPSREVILPEKRRGLLRAMFDNGRFVRVLEAHNGLSAIVAEKASVDIIDGSNGALEFDGIWVSSFTDSAAKGQPDVQVVSFDSRIETVAEITNVTRKPLIVDGDTGGDSNNFDYLLQRLTNFGVSAVIVEDQVWPKRNSLDKTSSHVLEDPKDFAAKLRRGIDNRLSQDLLIFSRIESFIAGRDLEDAVGRARIYLQAGVDGVMIHSNQNTPDQVLSFSREYHVLCRELGVFKPLICVPTTYNSITEDELREAGFNVVIYANHMLRAAHRSMEGVARSILAHGRSLEADGLCTPVKTIFEVVGFNDLKTRGMAYENGVKVVIPAAGKHTNLGDLCSNKPCSSLQFGDGRVIDYQLQSLKNVGISDCVVIRGQHEEKLYVQGVRFCDASMQDQGIMATLARAEKEFNNELLIVYSDILFTDEIIKKVLSSRQDSDIIIVTDNSYRLREPDYKSKLDLVVTNNSGLRQLRRPENRVLRIGKSIPCEQASAEFIGITYLSRRGAESLMQVYHDCLGKYIDGYFHEAESIYKASLTDVIQEIIDRGYNVKSVEVNHGWRELHSPDNYCAAVAEFGGVGNVK